MDFFVATAYSFSPDTASTLANAYSSLVSKLGRAPSFIQVHCTSHYDCNLITQTMNTQLAQNLPWQGETSALGSHACCVFRC